MSFVVIETYENLNLWEPVAVWGPFRTKKAGQRYIDSRISELEKDWRIDLALSEMTRP